MHIKTDTLQRSPSGGKRVLDGPETPALISIVTVCYNTEETIERTILSVAAQSDQHFEFIVIDGHSKDRTIEILREHDAHINRWISEPDQGIYDAMNKGAALATGIYVAFLNADDFYLPETIRKVRSVILERSPDVIHGNIIKEREINGEKYQREEAPNPDMMPSGMGIFHPATFVKMEIFRATGGFDTRYRLAADYDLMLRLWLGGKQFYYINKPLTIFSIAGVSNAGCGTYAEAVQIQTEHGTNTARQTKKLLRKCRRKKFLRTWAFRVARWTGTTSIIEKNQKNKWQ